MTDKAACSSRYNSLCNAMPPSAAQCNVKTMPPLAAQYNAKTMPPLAAQSNSMQPNDKQSCLQQPVRSTVQYNAAVGGPIQR